MGSSFYQALKEALSDISAEEIVQLRPDDPNIASLVRLLKQKPDLFLKGMFEEEEQRRLLESPRNSSMDTMPCDDAYTYSAC